MSFHGFKPNKGFQRGIERESRMPEKKRILVVLGHPDSQSFSQAIFNAYVAGVDRTRREVETLELGKLDFDPVLRFGYRARMAPDPVIERSQELVGWCNHMVFIFPCWWENMPALLKGWFDRVFTPGFAYNYQLKGIGAMLRTTQHLKGRTATLIATYDGPAWWFKLRFTSPTRLMKIANLNFCGVRVTRTLELSWTRSQTKMTDAKRQKFLDKVAAAAQTDG